MTDKIYISWDEFHRDTKALAEKIRAAGVYNKIIAVSRGGLLPAGILAYELGIRNSQAVNISSYDGENRRNDDEIEAVCDAGVVDAQTLIVDDLSDSGNTIRLLRRFFPKACYVTVYVKPAGKKDVDIFARELPDHWLVFPWD